MYCRDTISFSPFTSVAHSRLYFSALMHRSFFRLAMVDFEIRAKDVPASFSSS